MKKKIIIIAAVIAILLPIIAVPCIAFLGAPMFDNIFTAAVVDKLDTLEATKEKKLLVIGGSSSAFGLRSDLLEEEIGMKVINFGVYASLGTKLMLDLSRKYVSEGDIIVLAPELDAQTYSLYFSALDTLKGLDGSFRYLSGVAKENRIEIAGAIWKFTAEKLGYMFSSKPDPEGVYNRRSFNEYGDISYPRPYNIMEGGYVGKNISFDYDSVVSADFIAYLLDYAAFCRERGASVYFTYAPMNSAARVEGETQKQMADFNNRLRESFTLEDGTQAIKIISAPNKYVIDSAYFYDTDTHLNDAGAILRTARLAADLKRELGITEPVSIKEPSPPEKPAEQGGEEWATPGQTDPELFVLRNDGATYSIVGTKDGARSLSDITVPTYYNGKRITLIAKGAFSDCTALKSVTVPKGIRQIADGAFSGCTSLESIFVAAESCNDITVGDGLLVGVPDSCTIYLTNADVSDFNNHYSWSKYSERMKKAK